MLLQQQLAELKLINQNNGDVVAVIPPQQMSGLKFDKVINGISSLVVTMPFNQTIWDSFQIDLLAEVFTMNYNTLLLETEETFFLTGRDLYFEDGAQQMSFFGSGLVDLLSRRINKPTTTDDSSAGGWITRSGTAGVVMEEFANEQMIAPDDATRTVPNLTYLKTSDGLDVGIRTRYTSLFDTFNDLRVRGGVSYRITRDNEEDLVLEVGVLGDDKTYDTNFPNKDFLMFSPNIGNATEPYYKTSNKETQNFVYVTGEGQGVNQSILEIAGLGIADSIYNRREFVVNVRRGEGSVTSAAEQQLTAGVKGLSEKRPQDSYDFEIIENRLGFRYRVDWDLGDIVTFFWEDITEDFEIKSTTLSVSSNGIKREIKLELEGD